MKQTNSQLIKYGKVRAAQWILRGKRKAQGFLASNCHLRKTPSKWCPFLPGLTVVTRSPDSNNVTSSAVGTALPKFAIRGMLKTFGLHGVVLDVDSVSKDTLGGLLMISMTQLGAKTAHDAGLGLSWKAKHGYSYYCVTDTAGFGVAGE